MMKHQTHRMPAAILALGACALLPLSGCSTAPTAVPAPAGNSQDTNAAAAAPAGGNPADYNSAISPEQRAKIQSHKDRP